MKKIKILLILLLIGNIAFSQHQWPTLSNPDSLGLSSDTLQEMNRYFHSLIDEKRLGGIQTAIIKDGKLIHFDSYGYSDIEAGVMLNKENIFRIFSMTKPIVSVGLMQLYEQGKFALEDPVSMYIPEFKNSYVLKDSLLEPVQQPIRIVDLLRHTSGLSYGNTNNASLSQYYSDADLYSAKNNKEFIEKLSTIPLQFEPGTNWLYGLSTNICGYLIEVFSGKTLDEYLKEAILIPLKMNDTHFQLPESKFHRFTVGYGWNDDGLYIADSLVNNRYTNEVTLFNGGGGLVSTTFDYLNFCQMILNKGTVGEVKILKEETVALMLSDHLEETRSHQEERLRLLTGEASFGLGFSIRGENHNKQENVFGWGGAVGTYFKIDTDHNLAYVMMIQLSPYRQLGLRERIQQFVDAAIVEE